MLLPLIAAVVVVVIVFFTIRDREAETRAAILEGTGFALLALSTLFFAMFRVADTLDEHDGWRRWWRSPPRPSPWRSSSRSRGCGPTSRSRVSAATATDGRAA